MGDFPWKRREAGQVGSRVACKCKNRKARAVDRLAWVLAEIAGQSEQERAEFVELMAQVYRHTVDGDPNPTPDLREWTLAEGSICKAIYEEFTGQTLD